MFRVYKDKEKATYLVLTQDENEVDLDVVDGDGEHLCSILYIDENGTLRLCAGVDPDLGVQLDDCGYIKCEKE